LEEEPEKIDGKPNISRTQHPKKERTSSERRKKESNQYPASTSSDGYPRPRGEEDLLIVNDLQVPECKVRTGKPGKVGWGLQEERYG
jgi:hypothetical protein